MKTRRKRGFYVPDQSEEEKAEIHENDPVEDNMKIKRRKVSFLSESLPLSY